MKFSSYRSLFGAAAACGLLVTSAANALASPIAIAPGAQASYHTVFDGTFWNGQRLAFTRDLLVSAAADGSVAVRTTGTAAGDAATTTGTLKPDGTIVAAHDGDRVDGYNTLVAVLAKAPAQIHPGDSWTATVPVRYSPTQSFDLPLKVVARAADASATGIVVQADGAQSVNTVYGQFTVPVDVSVTMHVRFIGARFVDSDFAANEVVHAGPQTQTISWRWAMAPVAP
jgi:hypothetical protein